MCDLVISHNRICINVDKLYSSKFHENIFDGFKNNQHLQLCTARTALSDSVIRSAKIG